MGFVSGLQTGKEVRMSEDEYYEGGEEAEDAEAVAEAEDEAEDEYEDEEDADEEDPKDIKAKSVMSEGEEILMKRNEAKKGELDEQLKETINEWRKQRAKEEE